MPSAVIVRARLPAGLERLRRSSVADAAAGVPAHLTLLYPFVGPDELSRAVRRSLAHVARRHRPFDYTLRGAAAWPDTVYVAVAPVEPFVRLQRDLQAAFPAYPIYGRDATFEFEPHITIAQANAVNEVAIRADPAWRALPRRGRTEAIEVIASGPDERWRLVWRIPLGATRGRGASTPARPRSADRMRP